MANYPGYVWSESDNAWILAVGAQGPQGDIGITTATYSDSAPGSPTVGQVWIDSDSAPATSTGSGDSINDGFLLMGG